MAEFIRASEHSTLTELARNLEYILPFTTHSFLSEKEASEIWATVASSGISGRVAFDRTNSNLSFFAVDPRKNKPVGGLSVRVLRGLSNTDLKFCKDFSRVFNSDLASAAIVPTTDELWATLQQSRFARAIGRFSPFPTEAFMRWLRVFESASSLRYEGHPFSACLLVTKQMEWVKKSKSLKYVNFPIPLRFESAILREKWTRALLRDPLIGLVGIPIAGIVVGAVTFQESPDRGLAFAPHGVACTQFG
jgi:hypothetical protein